MMSLDTAIFEYMQARLEENQEHGTPLSGLKDHASSKIIPANVTPEQSSSTITTLSVIPQSPDDLNSLKAIVDNVHAIYGVGTHMKWLTIVGDQKVYSGLQKLKRQYGSEMD